MVVEECLVKISVHPVFCEGAISVPATRTGTPKPLDFPWKLCCWSWSWSMRTIVSGLSLRPPPCVRQSTAAVGSTCHDKAWIKNFRRKEIFLHPLESNANGLVRKVGNLQTISFYSGNRTVLQSLLRKTFRVNCHFEVLKIIQKTLERSRATEQCALWSMVMWLIKYR